MVTRLKRFKAWRFSVVLVVLMAGSNAAVGAECIPDGVPCGQTPWGLGNCCNSSCGNGFCGAPNHGGFGKDCRKGKAEDCGSTQECCFAKPEAALGRCVKSGDCASSHKGVAERTPAKDASPGQCTGTRSYSIKASECDSKCLGKANHCPDRSAELCGLDPGRACDWDSPNRDGSATCACKYVPTRGTEDNAGSTGAAAL